MPSFSIGSVLDVREIAKTAAVGQVVGPRDLIDVQSTLEAARHLRTNLEKLKEEVPSLWSLAQHILPLPQIEDAISICIGPHGELLDSASARLVSIRYQLKETRQRLIARLESILESPRAKKSIQELVIVEREGRYVIPVKVEMRRQLKGIVHDVSNTGATVFVEPWATVELGNEIRQLAAEEKREVERILTALTAQLGANQESISQNVALVAELDLALAKATYAEKVRASEPLIKNDSGSSNETRLRLIGARHPLLKGKVVPLSIEIGGDFSILIITGPNTGGKTVALKTVGLLALMAQAGMPIPASEGSYIPIFDGVFADIGDEQSIQETLSTFGWHMSNIIRIIQHSTGKSLVLLDELGTNTDPTEGAALGRAILHHFLSQKAVVVATTHYNDLKLLAHATPGMQNASLNFDPVTLAPTYHLTMGLPGGSNTIAIAARLGLPPQIIAAARNALQRKDQEVEKLLGDLKTERQGIVDLRSQVEKERAEAENLRNQLQDEMQAFKEKERSILQEARDNLRQTRDSLAREAAELRKQISKAESELKKVKSREKIQQAKQALATWHENMATPTWQVSHEDLIEPAKGQNISVGDKVWLRDMDLPGTVLSLHKSSRQVEVQVGQATLVLNIEMVERIGLSETKPPPQMITVPRTGRRTVSLELDLRGKRADAVAPELDRYLNDASLAHLTQVRIIHGFGTGTVCQIVRDTLSSHPLVESFRPGQKEEGGDGVTIAML
jgi:DNA mismatch repair protein MutS2